MMNYLACKVEKSVYQPTDLMKQFVSKSLDKICEINSNLFAYEHLDIIAFCYDAISALNEKNPFLKITLSNTFYASIDKSDSDYKSLFLEIREDRNYSNVIVLSVLKCDYNN